MLRKIAVRSVPGTLLLGLLIFVPAGTLAWPEGWIFLVLFVLGSLATGVWLERVDPALLAERMRPPLSRDQAPGDRLVMAAIMVVFCGWFILAGLDAKRFGWSHVPVWLEVVGALLLLSAFYGWYTVLRANTFASVNIRVQSERQQTVISTGPYAVVRHPMYSYALVMMIGGALLLGSLWSLIAVVLVVVLLVARIHGEEKMLLDGLDGYREYTGRVRFRLFPGIW